MVLVAAMGFGTATAAPAPKKDLVLVGTVFLIQPINAPDMIHNFEVSVSVDQVLSGALSSPTFTFAVHSPAKAFLEVGGVYEIRARWTGQGYQANDWEIHKHRKSRKKPAK